MNDFRICFLEESVLLSAKYEFFTYNKNNIKIFCFRPVESFEALAQNAKT